MWKEMKGIIVTGELKHDENWKENFKERKKIVK